MVRKLFAAAAAAVLSLLGAGAAAAAPAAPALHSSNCNVNTSFCNFLANYTADWWAYGTNGNQGIVSEPDGFSSQWWYRPRETGWGILEATTGNCLQFIPATGQIVTSSCSPGTSNTKELWHFDSGPSGSVLISNYYDGVGQYFWIDNATGVFVELVGGGAEAGSELYMRA